nr:FAD-dependent oxidoreductase [Microbacterium liquefaciens]
MRTETVDVVVVGGGVMGLATAWELVRRGRRPVVVDRFARGHHEGASHGATRNFNNAYDEDHYLDLLVRARAGWDALGDVDGEPLLRLHGLVTHGHPDLAAVHAGLDARGIPSAVLSPAETSARWPGMRFDGDVLWSSDAGIVRATETLRELERRIVAGGAEVRWNMPVAHIDEHRDGAAVDLADGSRLRAEIVIVTASAWTQKLLARFGLPRLAVTEETPAHFRPLTDATWPSFNHYVDPAAYPATVYGMPTPGEGVKVGFHRVGDAVDPDARPTCPRINARWRTTCASGCRGSTPRPPCRSAARTPRPTTGRSCWIAGAGSWWAPDSPVMASSSPRASAGSSPTSR